MFGLLLRLMHRFCAWNTTGEGVHSPRLFYLVRYIFREKAHLYAWSAIEDRRAAMLRAPKLLHIRDYGTGLDRNELVSSIAKHSVMKCGEAQFLARLVYHMSGPDYVVNRTRPLHIMELGTSLGLTTAYLATADDKNKVVTFEGSEQVAEMAQINWEKLQIRNIQQVLGPIDDTLYHYARESQDRLDFVLMDANHVGEATLRYFEWILPLMDPDGIIAIDDIRYSRDMIRAWKQIIHHEGVTATMDFGKMGLVFLYPQVQQRTYLLHI